METVGSLGLWAGFAAIVLVMLAIDLFVVGGGKEHRVSFREAATWSVVWITITLAFAGGLWWYLDGAMGREIANTKALEFITGYLIDVQNETHGPRTIEKSLQGYYKTIGCRLISMPEHQIGVNRGRFHGKRFTIICDDEALFVDQPKISAIDNLG